MQPLTVRLLCWARHYGSGTQPGDSPCNAIRKTCPTRTRKHSAPIRSARFRPSCITIAIMTRRCRRRSRPVT
ncbi:hypothetical protein DD607_26585, partial [Salmonella sp. 3DZ2-4SM]